MRSSGGHIPSFKDRVPFGLFFLEIINNNRGKWMTDWTVNGIVVRLRRQTESDCTP